MFAGIIEGIGRATAIRPSDGAAGRGAASRLEVELGDLSNGLSSGASVSVNGVCLTLVELRDGIASFDVVAETLRMTNLGELCADDAVNIERSLRVGDRVDGHFVQGHVEGVGEVIRVERDGGEWLLWTRAPKRLRSCIVSKGSIAIDGVSLTVADLRDDEFAVALIPTTLERTTLHARRAGDHVNLETDIFTRLVVARLDALLAIGERSSSVGARAMLREAGLTS